MTSYNTYMESQVRKFPRSYQCHSKLELFDILQPVLILLPLILMYLKLVIMDYSFYCDDVLGLKNSAAIRLYNFITDCQFVISDSQR